MRTLDRDDYMTAIGWHMLKYGGGDNRPRTVTERARAYQRLSVRPPPPSPDDPVTGCSSPGCLRWAAGGVFCSRHAATDGTADERQRERRRDALAQIERAQVERETAREIERRNAAWAAEKASWTRPRTALAMPDPEPQPPKKKRGPKPKPKKPEPPRGATWRDRRRGPRVLA